MESDSLKTVLQTLSWVMNTIFHQCVAVLACYMIWVPIENYNNAFSWHVILCTIGIFPLSAEAFILFFPSNVWSQDIQRKPKYWVHAALISLGFIFEVAGVLMIIVSKNNTTGAVHFQSSHAIVGLITTLLLILTIVCKLISLATRNLQSLLVIIWLKLGHNILGQISYLFCITTLLLGMNTYYFSTYTSDTSRTVAMICTGIISLYSLIYAWKSTYKQIISLRTFF